MRYYRFMAAAAFLASFSTAAFAQVLSPVPAAPLPSTIEIVSQMDVKTAPDIATVSAGVVTSGATAAAAMADNAARMNAVFAALKKAGIPDRDIQTGSVNINPTYTYGNNNEPPRIQGYQANNNVNVIMRDLKNIGPTLDALAAEGANQINGPTFGVEEPEDTLNRARAEAVKKARKRAEIYADAAGVQLRRVLSITEQMGYVNPGPVPMHAMALETKSSTPIAPGQVGLSVTVNVKFELAP